MGCGKGGSDITRKPIRIRSPSVTASHIHPTRVQISVETHKDLPSLQGLCQVMSHHTYYCVHCQVGSRAPSPRGWGTRGEPLLWAHSRCPKCLRQLRTCWPFLWWRNRIFLPGDKWNITVGFAECFSFYELIKQDRLVILIVVALDLMQSLGRWGESLTLLAVPWGWYPGLEVSFYVMGVSIS